MLIRQNCCLKISEQLLMLLVFFQLDRKNFLLKQGQSLSNHESKEKVVVEQPCFVSAFVLIAEIK